jgi:heme-degrading monooxygenase HmoA
MSVVKINAIEVPEGMGPELEKRFAARAKAVDGMAGFEGFQLLRPTGGSEKRYFVVTQWRSEEDFLAWVKSPAFHHGHAAAEAHAADPQPVATGSEVLSFEVVDLG